MVKLIGPHFSIGALGKFGNVTVYSIWKGVNYARRWLKPTNPQSANQGNRRVIQGGLGRSTKYIQANSLFQTYAKEVAPAGQSWVSYYAKYMQTTYFPDVAGFNALFAEFIAHGAAADFGAQAVALGLTNFDLAYKDMAEPFHSSLQLYCVAKYSTDQYLLDNLKFATAPYTKALADWLLADIQLMVADFTP